MVSEGGNILHEASGAGYLKTGAAELSAITEALSWCMVEGLQGSKIRIQGDSRYALGCMNCRSLPYYANHEIRVDLNTLCRKFKAEAVWTKGHAGDPLNERADELAGIAMKAFREKDNRYHEWKASKKKNIKQSK